MSSSKKTAGSGIGGYMGEFTLESTSYLCRRDAETAGYYALFAAKVDYIEDLSGEKDNDE